MGETAGFRLTKGVEGGSEVSKKGTGKGADGHARRWGEKKKKKNHGVLTKKNTLLRPL